MLSNQQIEAEVSRLIQPEQGKVKFHRAGEFAMIELEGKGVDFRLRNADMELEIEDFSTRFLQPIVAVLCKEA